MLAHITTEISATKARSRLGTSSTNRSRTTAAGVSRSSTTRWGRTIFRLREGGAEADASENSTSTNTAPKPRGQEGGALSPRRFAKARGVPLDGVGLQCHFVSGAAPTTFGNVAKLRLSRRGRSGHRTRSAHPVASDGRGFPDPGARIRRRRSACLNTPRCVGVTTWG